MSHVTLQTNFRQVPTKRPATTAAGPKTKKAKVAKARVVPPETPVASNGCRWLKVILCDHVFFAAGFDLRNCDLAGGLVNLSWIFRCWTTTNMSPCGRPHTKYGSCQNHICCSFTTCFLITNWWHVTIQSHDPLHFFVHFLRDHQWQSSARINSWGALLVICEKMVTMEVYRLHVYFIFLAVEPTFSWGCCGNIMMAVFHIFSKQCGSQRLMFVAWWKCGPPRAPCCPLPIFTVVWNGQPSASPDGAKKCLILLLPSVRARWICGFHLGHARMKCHKYP